MWKRFKWDSSFGFYKNYKFLKNLKNLKLKIFYK